MSESEKIFPTLNAEEVVSVLRHCADPDKTCDCCALFDVSDEDCRCSGYLKQRAAELLEAAYNVAPKKAEWQQAMMNTFLGGR